ncbi:hypothetical protein [Latilactobacillus fuchuensis]|uniref:hypothetical protein n=1 Tax=Latilactobacillus fuchuensis TaxID=164393 RepID=UPI00046A76AD|nr:hypothetical protein [Latilactobacillus fuchuensis]
MSEEFDYYCSLLNLGYTEAVDLLLNKYGASQDDYYREKSYLRFFNGEIKNITKGKATRTKEGLYCHHIFENQYAMLTDSDALLEQQVPFSAQKKENLVYCDLIEHLILHALIAKETERHFGYAGYVVHLDPMVGDWYINKNVPELEWEKNCYSKAFLTSNEAEELLNRVDKFVGD